MDHVLSHEVKELGTHILVCEVTYSTATSEKLNFRKFFKFQVKIQRFSGCRLSNSNHSLTR